MRYAAPGAEGAIAGYDTRYENFIDGDWVAPQAGEYFDDPSPVDGKVFTRVPRSRASDVELALDAAQTAAPAWGRTSTTERARVLEQIADRLEANLERLAVLESWENGKPVRETLAADLPLAIDHFRYFAAAIRTQEGSSSTIDNQTVAHHSQQPLGVIGQIIPWNFPILMASWQLAPALAAGNCVVLKPAEQTPASILEVVKVIADLLPPGVLNVVNGFAAEAGRSLEGSNKLAREVLAVALGLGAKSPNIFFPDVMQQEDEFLDKALEGFAMFCLNQGEVGTCPSRALIAESIYEEFIDKAVDRVSRIRTGNPLDTTVMVGAQASHDQLERVLSYLEIGKAEGADLLIGGDRRTEPGLEGGYYVQPTVFRGKNDMRIFQEEIFGPVLAVTTFSDERDALAIAHQTPYGLGAGVWTRDNGTAYRMGRDLQAGRVWTNCYHLYPAPAASGGHKPSGIGSENHQPTLDHYQQTRNILISYDPKPTGLF